jgi:hypothetical protein
MASKQGVRDPKSHRTPEQITKMGRTYNKRPEQIKAREERNLARAMMMREGKVSKGDGKDVDHKRPIRSGGKTTKGNLRVMSASKNRGWRDGV